MSIRVGSPQTLANERALANSQKKVKALEEEITKLQAEKKALEKTNK